MKKLLLPLTLLLLSTSLHAGKGKVRIASDHEGAYIYVDGKKKAMTGEGFTSILLEEGEHTIRVEKKLDNRYFPAGDWILKEEQNIFVGGDTSIKLKFDNLKKVLSQKGIINIKKNQIENAIFTPIGINSSSYKKYGCFENLGIYKDKYFTCGSNYTDSLGFVFNRRGKKVSSLPKSLENLVYLNDGRRIELHSAWVNHEGKPYKPILVDKNGNTIFKYKRFTVHTDSGIDVISNKVLFYRNAGINSNLRNTAWLREINTGKLISKIIIPKKLDGWDGFFKFSEDGKNILFSSGKFILSYNMKGKLLETINIESLDKKYKNDRWYIVDINYDNGLLISVFERDKDTLDIVKLENKTSKVLISNIKTRYYSSIAR